LLAGVLRSESFSLREKLEVIRLGRALESLRAPEDGLGEITVDEWLRRRSESENLRRNFWDLLCIAAMNEDPQIASAALFERVLRLALFRSPADSRLGIARVGLSDCYAEAAGSYLEARGGQVELNRSVSSFLIRAGVCEGVRLSDGLTIDAPRVVSAVPWFQFTKLLPEDVLRAFPFFKPIFTLRPAPIISINLWFDRPVTELEFAGLRGTTIQWLFNKGKIFGSAEPYISLVLSGAHAHIGRSKEELLEMAIRDLNALIPSAREARVVHSLILKERFATFSPSCEADQARPPASTPIRGLVLAGDWTATGLPATIEGAVQSGYVAAQQVLRAT